jgi:hypothetical protein
VLNKKARRGEFADIILLFFLVLILGVMYWFMTGFTNNSSRKLESTYINESSNEVTEIGSSTGLEEAIKELMSSGCKIVIDPKVYLNDPHYVSFEEFKSKALNTKLVILTLSDSGNILLVQIKKEQWAWIPS